MLTCIDRFTRWPEAIPLVDICAESICNAFYSGWVSRFGVPDEIVIDQGRQFESSLFKDLLNMIGSIRRRTTPYNPAANGLIERWHRTIKAALKCQPGTNSVRSLPSVLLGLRSVLKPELEATVAEMVYGTALRLPGEFLETRTDNSPLLSDFVCNLREQLSNVRPIESAHHTSKSAFIHENLKSCAYVFIREDAVKTPLQAPYNGPFKVLSRSLDNKTFTILVKGNPKNININRLKPAFYEFDNTSITTNQDQPPKTSSTQSKIRSKKVIFKTTPSPHVVTRSGRRIVSTKRFVPEP